MFRILIIEEIGPIPSDGSEVPSQQIERYSQRVEVIDLQSVIRAVNTPPRPPRAPRKDKGGHRPPKPE